MLAIANIWENEIVMLNFCFLYAIVWSAVLFTYLLGWSDLCVNLDLKILLFFVITILISIIVGIRNRRKFRFYKILICPPKIRWISWFIIIFCFFEFIYYNQIPLLSILLGKSRYASFGGIPTLHPLMVTLGSFFVQYNIYLFICFPKRKYLLFDYISLQLVLYLLQYNRGGLMISLSVSAIVYLASIQTKIFNKLRKKKYYFLIICISLVVIYCFGGLGNLRHGFKWNNSTYIQLVGQINNNYPSWLPSQFMWAYTYITSPLFNLNYNVTRNLVDYNIVGYLAAFIPDFISKRLFREFWISDIQLVVSEFTATAGFGKGYISGGLVGMYIMYIFLIGWHLFLLRIAKRSNNLYIPCLAIIASVVTYMFFTNTIAYSAISFPLFYPIIFILIKQLRA